MKKEVKIALTAIVAVVFLFFGMNFLKGLNVFRDHTSYKMLFHDLKGLPKNTSIYADGYKVGTISDIQYNYDKSHYIIAIADIDPQLRIPEGSRAMIETDLMGNIKVSLILANQMNKFIDTDGIIPGVDENGAMQQVQDMVPAIQAMLPKLDSILTSVNKLLADPALANTLHNAEATTANLKTSTAQLNILMASLNGKVPTMMNKADNVLSNAETLTNNLASVDVAGTMAQVNQTLTNLQKMTDAINNKEGSMGMLLYDKGLYNHLNNTMRDADSLVIDLKAHPKRYVHFSVFGSKDK